jgi:hypothetical protein
MVVLPTASRDTLSERVVRKWDEQMWALRHRYHVLMRCGRGNIVDDVSDLHKGFQSKTLAVCRFWEFGQLFSRPVACVLVEQNYEHSFGRWSYAAAVKRRRARV